MASGNTMARFSMLQALAPASGGATPDERNGHRVRDFDAAADEICFFEDNLPSTYGGGGVTIDTYWMASTATSGDIKVGAAYEENDPNNVDLDADSFGTESTATGTANATCGKVWKVTLTITHANMGSPAAGDPFRLRIKRVASDGADTMSGDAELHNVHVKET